MDISVVSNLIEGIENEDKDSRKNIYSMLGKMGKESGDRKITDILIGRLNHENDKYVLLFLLEALCDVPLLNKCDKIIPFTKDERHLVRHSAIKALGNCSSPEAEKTLIDILQKSSDKYNLIYANSSLSKIGTKKAIPQLTKLLKHRVRDVKSSADYALKAIESRSPS